MTSLSVKFDLAPIERMADRLENLQRKALVQLSAVDAVNEVALRFETEARKGMNAGLNLSDAYVMSKMQRFLAVGTKAKATLVTRGDLTVLSHFPYTQLTTPTARGGGKGDPKRGIAPGLRAAGVSADIRKGDTQSVKWWFTMTLRRGRTAGEQVGVFYRNSSGQISHKYGPSPYSLFRYQVNAHSDELMLDLERTATAAASAAINRALT